MILRPVDASGDILPLLSSSDMLSGPEAVALLVQDRLSLLQGEWWENPSVGFPILERMREDRVTEADAASLVSMISAYIRETSGVLDVSNESFSVSGRQFTYVCTVRTEEGSAEVSYVSS